MYLLKISWKNICLILLYRLQWNMKWISFSISLESHISHNLEASGIFGLDTNTNIPQWGKLSKHIYTNLWLESVYFSVDCVKLCFHRTRLIHGFLSHLLACFHEVWHIEPTALRIRHRCWLKNPLHFQSYIFDTKRNCGKQKSYDSYLVIKGSLED